MASSGRQSGGWGASPIPLAVRDLDASALDFDVYVKRRDSDSLVLYRERSLPISPADLDRLVRRGVTTLYVAADDGASYCRYADERIRESQSAPATQQYKVLTDVRRAMFRVVFRDGSTEEVLEFADDFSSHLVHIVCDNDLILSDLFHLMRHDDYTYTHCVNVCTYAAILAKSFDFCENQDLTSIARGALLHDIGKRMVDRSVLNKPGRLTPEERAAIEGHPLQGFQELALREDVSWGELMMVYQHHERVDGQGYPVGLPGPEIHPWARICAIADVFHALTSQRPYRDPLSCEEACQFLERHSDVHVDEEMVQCWTSMMTAGMATAACS